MSILLSSSSDSVDKAIDEYSDHSSFSGSSDSDSSSGSSSGGNTTDEYISGVPGVPLEVLQEGLQTRFESGAQAGTSATDNAWMISGLKLSSTLPKVANKS